MRIATSEEIAAINEKEPTFKVGVGHALAFIYREQRWTPEKIAARIRGLRPGTWRGYAQPGYANNRSLHVVAAFSWLSQVSMLALLKGSLIRMHWDGMDEHSVSAILHMCQLTRNHFFMLVEIMLDKLKEMGVAPPVGLQEKIAAVCDSSNDFLAPQVLDLEAFRADYYASTGAVIRGFRERTGYTVEQMAHVLGVNEERYLSFETPDQNTNIPIQTAFRLKLGFHMADTTGFLVEMKEFPGFYRSRKVQQMRDEIIFELFACVPDPVKQGFVDLARQNMLFRQIHA
ncbi:hypothetical protein [Teredinibacter turnerae]|uniref:hypothetical protein n=1 Tax=Teredinibacter turnerae TaxID=2426 RepID=UPI0004921EB0